MVQNPEANIKFEYTCTNSLTTNILYLSGANFFTLQFFTHAKIDEPKLIYIIIT